MLALRWGYFGVSWVVLCYLQNACFVCPAEFRRWGGRIGLFNESAVERQMSETVWPLPDWVSHTSSYIHVFRQHKAGVHAGRQHGEGQAQRGQRRGRLAAHHQVDVCRGSPAQRRRRPTATATAGNCCRRRAAGPAGTSSGSGSELGRGPPRGRCSRMLMPSLSCRCNNNDNDKAYNVDHMSHDLHAA